MDRLTRRSLEEFQELVSQVTAADGWEFSSRILVGWAAYPLVKHFRHLLEEAQQRGVRIPRSAMRDAVEALRIILEEESW